MPFESLSHRNTIRLNDFPDRWLPLIHLYDPDLPLFPIYYFHATADNLTAGQRPNYADRIFGYIERINALGDGIVDIVVIINKDLDQPGNAGYQSILENLVKERLGLSDPVRITDVSNAFNHPLDYANPVLSELWNRVVSDTYDNILPFGRLWDEVLGLTRFVASWYSSGGRKGELIQTHYFASKFGERIQSAAGIPQIDFYLLPTIAELLDTTNPLNIFPKYAGLITVANNFQQNNCTTITVGSAVISKFNHSVPGKLNTAGILSLLAQSYIPQSLRPLATECFNTFDKGPQRTVIFLLMLSDIRNGRLNPSLLNNHTLGSIYDGLKNTYQSPKVIHIYAQQCFGNTEAMPIDVWIDTFLHWPLNIHKNLPRATRGQKDYLFLHSNNLGKVERLLWVAAQARKVHSSACNDAIWCTKMASNKIARGANPLACKICLTSIRQVCPAYADIQNQQVVFNTAASANQFSITTSANNNTTPNQKFTSCNGKSIYITINDDFSPADSPNGLAPYPSGNHTGTTLTVEEFVNTY